MYNDTNTNTSTNTNTNEFASSNTIIVIVPACKAIDLDTILGVLPSPLQRIEEVYYFFCDH